MQPVQKTKKIQIWGNDGSAIRKIREFFAIDFNDAIRQLKATCRDYDESIYTEDGKYKIWNETLFAK